MLTAIGLGWTLDVSYATQVFNYDSIGNIESKTGVGNGNYAYPPSGATSFGTYGASNNRPHAVQSIPGIGSFTYDDNGNLKNGAGRSVEWTSFDMPEKITKGNESSSFAYGADHQRTKQMKSDGGANTSTIYYAGAMEVETKSGTVQSIKTYWPGGIGFEIDKPTQATELNWIHTDRLGSVIAISNASGTLVERLAYDSWGKRRSLSGNETPDSIDGVKDNKGFTGHEMLDKLDLVHMNGRIYDPLIARFMSADPIIQDPEHSRSYNRYTYVWNNPTNLTDPTGFVAMEENASAPENPEPKPEEKPKEPPPQSVVFKKLAGPCSQNSKCIGTLYSDGVFAPSEQGKNQSADNSGGKGSAIGGGQTITPETTQKTDVKREKSSLQDVKDWLNDKWEKFLDYRQEGADLRSAALAGDKAAQDQMTLNIAMGFAGTTSIKISGGHSFSKHVLGVGARIDDPLFRGLAIRTVAQLEKHIAEVMANPTATRTLMRDRVAYFHEPSGTVVIHNPRASDLGTAFQPTNAKAYFEGLK
ncbi:RHS repeat domain-containing protein [Undibacterium danionis]|uniref:RHS repeat domain-containing protein n=1 Tax=Undibacterium danionis TaxID=1812100 RepID=A0ABV6IBX1_9BURK